MKEKYRQLSISADLSASSLGQALVELGEARLYVSRTDFDWAKSYFKGMTVIFDEELLPYEWYVKTKSDKFGGEAVGSKL